MEVTPRASPPPPPPQAVPQLWQHPGVMAGGACGPQWPGRGRCAGDARDYENGSASEGGGTERSCSSVGDICCTRSQAACAARMMCCAWPRADPPRAARCRWLARGRGRARAARACVHAALLTTLRAAAAAGCLVHRGVRRLPLEPARRRRQRRREPGPGPPAHAHNATKD